jgi:GDPmannose 4,6-dehydratase
MKAIVFGISGQDGFYLNALLKAHGIEVIGVSRKDTKWIVGNVSDRFFVEKLIKQNEPDYVFHLAANSTTNHDAIFENHETVVTGTLNILEACYKYSNKGRIFLSGSAVQFQNNGEPINETTPFAANSPYAVSRISSVFAGRYYRSLGLKTYVGYFFNHDSPLRTERHINQKIILAVRRIMNGENENLEIGNINTKKEFNYAVDIVEAIWLLVNQDEHYEAVIGSGQAFSIKEWVELCFQLAGLDWKKFVHERQNFKAEYEILVSNPGLINSLGWRPKTSIELLAKTMFEQSEKNYKKI